MAILHQAQLHPSKMELIEQWLRAASWYDGPAQPKVTQIASFRFDDPAGEVGVETHIVRVDGGPILQVPLTYRGAPIQFGESDLVGTMTHSVLGDRWVYDGTADPVYTDCITGTILNGGSEAQLFRHADGHNVPVESSAHVVGSGPGSVSDQGYSLRVVRQLGADAAAPDGPTLTGTWDGQETPILLAYLESR
ncbi:MAG: hypothetical protein GX542_07535 [Rhodococcus sp.]|nr:hypothetical protein [Rhodococcus sp. (in: high G+C Gram-positive bacteria)]